MCTKVWIFFTKGRLEVSPPPRRRKYRELDSRLELVRHSYELGVYTTEEYLTHSDPTHCASLLNRIVMFVSSVKQKGKHQGFKIHC